MGRKTFTLLFPVFSRVSMPLLLFMWTSALLYISEVSWMITDSFLLLSMVVGIRFAVMRTALDDRFSFMLYTVSPELYFTE